jgi:hypothetical protein
MRKSLVLAFTAASLFTASANASPLFNGNSCTLVSAKQTASFGIPGPCKPTKHNSAGFTASSGAWNLTSPTVHLFVGVNTYASKSSQLWQLGMQTLHLLPGHATKVKGIGSLAYESGGDGSTISAINFVVGNRIVTINMRTKTAPKSLAAFNALAKSIAAKL